MKTGLISDSHGAREHVRLAANRFKETGVEIIIHTGDVTRPGHLEPLLETNRPVHLTPGNMDTDPEKFKYLAKTTNLSLHRKKACLEKGGQTLGFTHGHSDSFLRQLKRETPDYLIHGHTHERRDETVNSTRIINPGSAGSAPPTAAVLDLDSDELNFFKLEEPKT